MGNTHDPLREAITGAPGELRLQRQLGAATKAPSSYAKRQQAYRKQKKQMHAKQGEEPNNGTLYFLMFFFGPPAAIALFRFIYL